MRKSKRVLSDVEAVKRMARVFLHIDIQETELSPMFVSHPVFEYGIQCIDIDGVNTPINILEDEKGYQELIFQCEKVFEKQESVKDVCMLIRSAYRLTFLKHIKSYLSKEDFSSLLSYAWTSAENPNQDTNVSLRTAVSWFKKADKNILMEAGEYSCFQNLPEQLTIYRGVSVGRNPNGLSWTCSLEIAEWFAHRFDQEHKKGFVQKAEITRDSILAYFSRRNEDELVVDIYKIKDKIQRI